ncbi:MAG: hypothetical protein MUC81_08875 [Bacteroidia bacterium]|nr:hypothetical protein [Bacteroidia bacterium]
MKNIGIVFKKASTAIGIAALTALTFSANARENKGLPKENELPEPKVRGKMANCLPATQQRDLDVNNVRTTILNGGDMWWNLSNARYEIPKIETGQVAKHSLFAGALWIGGVTSGNLKIAAQTYRQSGNDFYPGPLVNGVASISADKCKAYDKIWRVTLREITDLVEAADKNAIEISDDIESWPGNGDVSIGEAAKLAPFFDFDNDGIYDPRAGDYPTLNDGNPDVDNIPDMMLFLIYNDKGNIHTESEGLPIGLELHTQAFAYSTNNEINNMTFYRTTIFNRSNEIVDSTVFGQWVDPDLGNYSDDYVECDVSRNLGICYNGDDNDEGILGYGLNPPSVGVTFFEGPRRPDSSEIGLTKFVYYNNDFSLTGNPSRPEHFWGYLNGRWKDGASITYGGNGRGGSDTASYMFPGNTDPAGRATWNERIAGNQPQDRRFLQTAGSFRLLPGAVNRVTIGVVWARASSGGATGSFNLLKQASDRATTLYKNNFTLKNGPEAPKLEIVELDRKIVIKMTRTKEIEEFRRTFAGPCNDRTEYRFQGYQIFQVLTPSIPSDVFDQEQARLVAQFDIVDGVSRVVNTLFDPELEENVKKIMVDGTNTGIQHTFEITKDAFETGSDQTVSNFKTYYYYIVSYATAVNCANDFEQYLSSAKTADELNLLIYTAVPHDPTPSGLKPNSTYGTGIPLTQLEGIGNGGKEIRLSKASIEEALNAPYYSRERKYESGFSPVTVKVINPLKVPKAEFELAFRDTSANPRKTDTLSARNTRWTLKNLTTGEIKNSDTTLAYNNEQVFEDWGISVQVNQSIIPGDAESPVDQSNGFISSSIVFPQGANEWLTGVIDEDPNFSQAQTLRVPFNWIRAGSTGRPDFNNPEEHDFAINRVPIDPRKNFSSIINSRWAPYALAARWRTTNTARFPSFGPAWDGAVGAVGTGFASTDNQLADLHSVRIFITSDKSKWSRCAVIETGENTSLNVGNAEKMDIRKSPSVDKNGEPDGTGTGMGWFPGYAIDMETGERLNIMFGEDSSIPEENGSDMIWNPTANLFNRLGRPVFGGKHYIYVMGSKQFDLGTIRYRGPRYDECADYAARLSSNPPAGAPSAYLVRKRQVYSQVYYTSMPLTTGNGVLRNIWQGLVPSDVTISINVKRPYASFSVDANVENDSMPLFRFKTDGFATLIGDKSVAKKALDKVSIVPNPYYAYSQYEDPGNQLDNRIKITNLPPKCLVQIYTQEGVVVRTIRKDDPTQTFVVWDLKNNAKVPIASGIYLIHIKSDDLGEERIIKWFGIMRPVDYDTF